MQLKLTVLNPYDVKCCRKHLLLVARHLTNLQQIDILVIGDLDYFTHRWHTPLEWEKAKQGKSRINFVWDHSNYDVWERSIPRVCQNRIIRSVLLLAQLPLKRVTFRMESDFRFNFLTEADINGWQCHIEQKLLKSAS